MYAKMPQLAERVELKSELQKLQERIQEFTEIFITKYSADKAHENLGNRIDLMDYELTKL